MHLDDEGYTLEREVEIYGDLACGIGVPEFHWFGSEGSYNALVQELLGPSLEDLLIYCGGKLSLKTVLLIADQAIGRVKYIHSKGYLHSDIKPDNFAMGTQKKGNLLHIIDFGVSQVCKAHERREPLTGLPFYGSSNFASPNCHHGIGTSNQTLSLVRLR